MGALKFEITGTCESLKNALRDAQTAFHTTADAAEQQGQRIDALLGKLKETADELNGRFTALQIAGEQAKVNTDLIVSAVNTLVVKTDANFITLSEVRNMMIITNSYLEDIRKYNKLTYEEFGSKLDDIKMSLKNL